MLGRRPWGEILKQVKRSKRERLLTHTHARYISRTPYSVPYTPFYLPVFLFFFFPFSTLLFSGCSLVFPAPHSLLPLLSWSISTPFAFHSTHIIIPQKR